MSVPKLTRVWILNKRPTDAITDETFRVEEKPLPAKSELEKGQFIVKTVALSNDPAQRTWMDDHFDPVCASQSFFPVIPRQCSN
jgi:NADPH-dependent curcumin reductase CurA